jgi:hypothetical protein
MTRRPVSFTQSDLARALRAVKQAGIRAAVKLAPDGTILILPDDRHGENPQVVKEQVAVEREAIL